jgi:MOSC domain-containing protein YiiM
MQVGTPQRYGTPNARRRMDRPWETSFFRTPSAEARWLYTTHLDGNAQADTKNHGKPDQAVLVYAGSHYPLWRDELDLPEIGPGGFGENFTVDGITEATVCIGDTFAIGDARIQVTGPRYPCTKIERRWRHPGLTNRVAATGRTGWYCRVLHEGLISPGSPIALVDRPHPEVTVALINDFGHYRNQDVEQARALAACPLLPEWWQVLIVRRATGHE